jgi:hypothetical protein
MVRFVVGILIVGYKPHIHECVVAFTASSLSFIVACPVGIGIAPYAVLRLLLGALWH